MRRLLAAVAFGIGAAGVAHAQDKPATIDVVGVGSVETPPDIATITYSVRGEGRTSDAAAKALADRRAAIADALGGVPEAKFREETGDLRIREVRDDKCGGEDEDFGDRPRLSTGNCAVVGYTATLAVTLKVTPVAQAGTLAGLVGRGGGSDVSLEDFDLSDATQARQRAIAAAVANGRRQAEAIAAASGAKLGRLLHAQDNDARMDELSEVVVTGSRLSRTPAPVRIDIAPEPVTTTARLSLSFELLP